MAREEKGGLGKGLAALLGASSKEETHSTAERTVQETEDVSRETIYEPTIRTVSNPSLSGNIRPISVGNTGSQRPVVVNNPAHSGQIRPVSASQSQTSSNPVNETQTTQTAPQTSSQTSYVQPYKEAAETKEEPMVQKTKEGLEFQELPIANVEPNPEQPRTDFDKVKLNELANSINDQGVLQPILVRKLANGKYQIIAGERRWQASRIARKATIPAVIVEYDDVKSLEAALIENIQRENLNPIEEAYAYKRLMDKNNYTQAELAQVVSKGRSTIANAIRLLDLPESAQEAMFKGELTAGHARAILSVPTEKGRETLTDKIVNEKLSVRDAETIAKLLSIDPSKKTATKKASMPSEFTAIAKSLRKALNLKIKVKSSKTGNTLVIPFENAEDLQKIADKLTAE